MTTQTENPQRASSASFGLFIAFPFLFVIRGR